MKTAMTSGQGKYNDLKERSSSGTNKWTLIQSVTLAKEQKHLPDKSHFLENI